MYVTDIIYLKVNSKQLKYMYIIYMYSLAIM